MFDNLFNQKPRLVHGSKNNFARSFAYLEMQSNFSQSHLFLSVARTQLKNVVKLSPSQKRQNFFFLNLEKWFHFQTLSWIFRYRSGEKHFVLWHGTCYEPAKTFFCLFATEKTDEELWGIAREKKNVNFDDHRESEMENDPPATRFYVISTKDMQINVLINNRLYRRPATGRRHQ